MWKTTQELLLYQFSQQTLLSMRLGVEVCASISKVFDHTVYFVSNKECTCAMHIITLCQSQRSGFKSSNPLAASPMLCITEVLSVRNQYKELIQVNDISLYCGTCNIILVTDDTL
jgi:hypothetical protein